MKRHVISLLFTVMVIFCASAQASMATAAYVHGYWSHTSMQNNYSGYFPEREFELIAKVEGDKFCGMEIRKVGEQPWNWCFKFEIDDYYKPTKKNRNLRRKSDLWFEFTGWVEYYVSDEYPTIEKVLETFEFPKIQPTGETARAKRRAKAKIMIAPYKDAPKCYNIFFDNVGVKIEFSECPFEKSYFVL